MHQMAQGQKTNFALCNLRVKTVRQSGKHLELTATHTLLHSDSVNLLQVSCLKKQVATEIFYVFQQIKKKKKKNEKKKKTPK